MSSSGGIDEFSDYLANVATATNMEFSLKTLTRIAMQELKYTYCDLYQLKSHFLDCSFFGFGQCLVHMLEWNLFSGGMHSVRNFWMDYKIYMMGAYGNSPNHLEKFKDTKMGTIVAAYGKLYGREVYYDVVVKDVLMYMEQYFRSDYLVNVSDLGALVREYEDCASFENDHNYWMIRDIIKREEQRTDEEGPQRLKITTSVLNADVTVVESTILESLVVPVKSKPAVVPVKCEPPLVPVKCEPPLVPVKCEPPLVPVKFKPAVVPVKSKAAVVPVKCEPLLVPVKCEPPLVPDTKVSSPAKQFPPLNLAEKAERLRERAKKMRRSRKDGKPFKDSQAKYVVETTALGRPKGRGLRELLHVLSTKVLDTFPLGIQRKEVASTTFTKIIDKAKEDFSGDWTTSWAEQKMNATMRVRRSRVMNMLKHGNTTFTPEQRKEIKRAMKHPDFVQKSKRLRESRAKVCTVSHAGRGGVVQIKQRYRQEHGSEPSEEKVREIANTEAARKADVE